MPGMEKLLYLARTEIAQCRLGWAVRDVVEFLVRSVKALGACCFQGEDPVLQGSALIW